MVRRLAVAFVLSCLASLAWAQAQPAPAAIQPAPSGKPPPKKPAPKQKIAKKPPVPLDNGACQIGVIPAIGDRFAVQKMGLTVFGNDLTEVPIEAWALDDLVVARVRAAAGAGVSVRRIAYAKDAFQPYYHPAKTLFRDAREDLKTVVRQIAVNSTCERYVVVTKFGGILPGTNQELRGIGVFTNWTNGVFKKGSLFANIRVTVLDGQSFAIQQDPSANFGARLAASLSGKNDSQRTLENFETLESPESAAGNAALRDGTRSLLSEKLDRIISPYFNQ
jgi:hypothetical protein